MLAVQLIRRAVRFGFRAVVVPALVASVALGAVSGPHGLSAHLTPQPAIVASALQAHHDLPKGTTLTLGDPAKPFVIAYESHGGILVTPPKGETFGTVLVRGFSQMSTLPQQVAAATKQTSGTNVATAQTLSKQ
jgi:hypothetical protein